MIRVIFVVKNMRLSNGIASYAMNYFRRLNGNEIRFDFLIISDVGSPYYKDIEQDGSKVYLMPSYKRRPLEVIPFLKKLFTETHYDVLHCNVMNSGSLVLKIAKKYGIPVRILHSHATQTGDKKWKQIRNKLFCGISLKNANYYFSCSHLAGDYLFGKDNYHLILNAIEVEKYAFNASVRKKLREEEQCDDKLVLMTVGRFTKQKNPEFIVEIVKALQSTRSDFVLWWFGNGELEVSIKEKARESGADKNIKFWGANSSVNEYYSAADVFILPSIYEGLPVVGIEAQVAGLPIIFSDCVTREAQIAKNVKYLSIADAMSWASEICEAENNNHLDNLNGIDLSMYRIENQCGKLKQLYYDLLSKEKAEVK